MSFFIQPNTTISLCRNVPLTPSYVNTLYFEREEYQYNYFISKVGTGLTFTQQSYQRRNRNRLRIHINAELIDDVNYLIFNNGRMNDPQSPLIVTSKTYYAFILDTKYINENVSEITYMIDVMQTWMFNYTLQPCYVVREHVSDDAIGKHTEPEALDIGPYDYESVGNLVSGDGMSPYIVFATTFEYPSLDDYYGGMQGGVYSGLNYICFPATTAGIASAQQFVDDSSTKIDGIVYCFMAPKFIADIASTNSFAMYSSNLTPNTSWTFASDSDNQSAPNYPRNNKMYCYPYNFFGVSNNEGDMGVMRWELWERNQSGKVEYTLVGALSSSAEMQFIPDKYAGTTGLNYNEKVTSGNWPQCSWNNDPYKAWFATTGRIQRFADIQDAMNILFGLGQAAQNFYSSSQTAPAQTQGNYMYSSKIYSDGGTIFTQPTYTE